MPNTILAVFYLLRSVFYFLRYYMKNISFSAAAQYAGITRDQLRYWIKLLNIKSIKEGRTLFLPNGSEKLLEAMHQTVKSGLSLKASAQEVLNIHTLPQIIPEHQNIESNQILTDRISSLEKAVMLLVEQNKALAGINETQNQVFAESFMRQEKRLDKIQLQLNPPKTNKKIEVWKPSIPKRPKLSIMQRIWYEVTNPIKLRAN